MPDFYDELQGITSALFTQFDQRTVSYVRMISQPGATPDEPLPSIPTLIPIAATARGVQYKYVARGLAVASDLQVSFAGSMLDVEPSITDFVDIGDTRCKIVEIVRIPAAGVPLAYTLIVRR